MSTVERFSGRSLAHILKPYKIAVEQKNDERRRGVLTVEPLERGFGTTLGNSLRRVLLSSIQGTAVTGVKIEGVLSEFSHVPGMKEDVAEMILNVKKLELNLHGSGPKKVRLLATGPGVVTAASLREEPSLEILSPDQYICSLEDGAELSMELTVDHGSGYVSGDTLSRNVGADVSHALRENSTGFIRLDAHFSPIKRVSFHVEKVRLGSRTDFDRLLMDVETNGSLTPKQAVNMGARILQEHLNAFVDQDFADQTSELKVLPTEPQEKSSLPFPKTLLMKVEDLNLSLRCMNGLKSGCIVYLGDLVKKTEAELLAAPNFGRKSLDEIKSKLSSLELKLGMDFPEWPPKDIEQFSKSFGVDIQCFDS
jgi:DNA-directed RNA polymerase subunit alpha